ncbi:MAG: Hsp20/alpha crystallin family protein [Mariniphaga sp.]
MNILRFSNPLGCNALSVNTFNDLLRDIKDETMYSMPQANVVENKDGYRIELAVPGYTKEQIGIQFQDHVLVLKGNVEEKLNEGEKYLSREFGLKNFVRRFVVPKTVDSSVITASFSNGILSVDVPKKEETKENLTKDIQIN